jgi:hypothetical protein
MVRHSTVVACLRLQLHVTNGAPLARLVTKEVTEAYIPEVNEEVTKQVPITILDEQSYWYGISLFGHTSINSCYLVFSSILWVTTASRNWV